MKLILKNNISLTVNEDNQYDVRTYIILQSIFLYFIHHIKSNMHAQSWLIYTV